MSRTQFEEGLVDRLHALAAAAPEEPSRPRRAGPRRGQPVLAAAVIAAVAAIATALTIGADLRDDKASQIAVGTESAPGSGLPGTTSSRGRPSISVPFEATRTRPDGVTVTLNVAPFPPTYGPYGSDHLLYRAPTCPASANVEISKGEIGKGGGMRAVLPVVLDGRRRQAYLSGQPGRDLVVLVPGTEVGHRYRLIGSNGAIIDEAVATDPAVALVDWQVEVRGPADAPPTARHFDGRVEDLDADGNFVSSVPVETMDIEALTPRSCWPAAQPVELGPDVPPPDRAAAESAVGDAISRIGEGLGPYVEDVPIEVVEVRWERPTIAWVKYRVAYFADDDGDGAGTGPIVWGDVRFDGLSWAAAPAARCVYDRLSGRGSTCPEAPDTVPVE